MWRKLQGVGAPQNRAMNTPHLSLSLPPSLSLSLSLALLTLSMAGCSVELDNRRPAQALAASRQLPGDTEQGWAVFQAKCASCHGPDAEGTPLGPDLLPRVRTMGPREFVSRVLTRYDWGLPPAARTPGAEQDALVAELTQRQGPVLSMPAWQGRPMVQAHIMDLYAYVSARAQGTLGPVQPPPAVH